MRQEVHTKKGAVLALSICERDTYRDYAGTYYLIKEGLASLEGIVELAWKMHGGDLLGESFGWLKNMWK